MDVGKDKMEEMVNGRFGESEKKGSKNIHVDGRKVEKRKRKREIEFGKKGINRIADGGKRVDIAKRKRKRVTH